MCHCEVFGANEQQSQWDARRETRAWGRARDGPRPGAPGGQSHRSYSVYDQAAGGRSRQTETARRSIAGSMGEAAKRVSRAEARPSWRMTVVEGRRGSRICDGLGAQCPHAHHPAQAGRSRGPSGRCCAAAAESLARVAVRRLPAAALSLGHDGAAAGPSQWVQRAAGQCGRAPGACARRGQKGKKVRACHLAASGCFAALCVVCMQWIWWAKCGGAVPGAASHTPPALGPCFLSPPTEQTLCTLHSHYPGNPRSALPTGCQPPLVLPLTTSKSPSPSFSPHHSARPCVQQPSSPVPNFRHLRSHEQRSSASFSSRRLRLHRCPRRHRGSILRCRSSATRCRHLSAAPSPVRLPCPPSQPKPPAPVAGAVCFRILQPVAINK